MATIIEIQEDKLEGMAEYTEKILRYGGKLMQCIEDMERKSKYNEYYGHERKPHEKDPYGEERHINRYY
jgi:hypothetical protein